MLTGCRIDQPASPPLRAVSLPSTAFVNRLYRLAIVQPDETARNHSLSNLEAGADFQFVDEAPASGHGCPSRSIILVDLKDILAVRITSQYSREARSHRKLGA